MEYQLNEKYLRSFGLLGDIGHAFKNVGGELFKNVASGGEYGREQMSKDFLAMVDRINSNPEGFWTRILTVTGLGEALLDIPAETLRQGIPGNYDLQKKILKEAILWTGFPMSMMALAESMGLPAWAGLLFKSAAWIAMVQVIERYKASKKSFQYSQFGQVGGNYEVWRDIDEQLMGTYPTMEEAERIAIRISIDGPVTIIEMGPVGAIRQWRVNEMGQVKALFQEGKKMYAVYDMHGKDIGTYSDQNEAFEVAGKASFIYTDGIQTGSIVIFVEDLETGEAWSFNGTTYPSSVFQKKDKTTQFQMNKRYLAAFQAMQSAKNQTAQFGFLSNLFGKPEDSGQQGPFQKLEEMIKSLASEDDFRKAELDIDSAFSSGLITAEEKMKLKEIKASAMAEAQRNAPYLFESFQNQNGKSQFGIFDVVRGAGSGIADTFRSNRSTLDLITSRMATANNLADVKEVIDLIKGANMFLSDSEYGMIEQPGKQMVVRLLEMGVDRERLIAMVKDVIPLGPPSMLPAFQAMTHFQANIDTKWMGFR